jgi:hypothetical protein
MDNRTEEEKAIGRVIWEGPALLTNKMFVVVMGTTVRITFTEQPAPELLPKRGGDEHSRRNRPLQCLEGFSCATRRHIEEPTTGGGKITCQARFLPDRPAQLADQLAGRLRLERPERQGHRKCIRAAERPRRRRLPLLPAPVAAQQWGAPST